MLSIICKITLKYSPGLLFKCCQKVRSALEPPSMRLMSAMPSLTSIAEDLLVKARQIDAYLEQNHLPEPSFDNDVLMNLPAELEAVRTSMADGSNDLKNLIRGPVGMTMDIALNVGMVPSILST